jgi:DNA-binding XRE family transcriptional regulator
VKTTTANPRAPKFKALNQEPAHITRAREWAGLTKTQLAAEAGISLSLMSDIEHGARSATPPVLTRIAYMVVNKQDHPICLEIKCPAIGIYTSGIYDGNHRFAAAIVRKDKKINVTFVGGVDEFHQMFRSAKEVRL